MSDDRADADPHVRFADATYETFQEWAADPSMSPHERGGFPDAYREGAEGPILADIEAKLPALRGAGATVVDIGCGAAPLAIELTARCAARGHELVLIDGPAVLSQHPDAAHVRKLAGRFPDVPGLGDLEGRCQAVLAYSVLQYVFREGNVFAFLDAALALLAPGGRLLLGDLPNATMRRRFLASDAGRAYHREYSGRDEDPPVAWPLLPHGELDDGAVLGLLARARDGGHHAWLVPQPPELPMANRREDLLIARP